MAWITSNRICTINYFQFYKITFRLFFGRKPSISLTPMRNLIISKCKIVIRVNTINDAESIYNKAFYCGIKSDFYFIIQKVSVVFQILKYLL